MSYAPVYPIQQVCPGCMQNSRSFSLLLLSLPRRISKKNFFKIYREEYINPCPSFCFKTIKTLDGLERERKARYKLSSTILILSVLRSRIWNSRPQTWTWIRPSLMYPCRACKRKKKRKERKGKGERSRDKESYTGGSSRNEEHSEGCKSLERREIKKNGGEVALSIRRITGTRENVLRRRMARRRRDENLWAVLLESRIQFKCCWSRRDKVARMIDAALHFFCARARFVCPCSVAFNGGWQSDEEKEKESSIDERRRCLNKRKGERNTSNERKRNKMCIEGVRILEKRTFIFQVRPILQFFDKDPEIKFDIRGYRGKWKFGGRGFVNYRDR